LTIQSTNNFTFILKKKWLVNNAGTSKKCIRVDANGGIVTGNKLITDFFPLKVRIDENICLTSAISLF
jgi:hypothetical protein